MDRLAEDGAEAGHHHQLDVVGPEHVHDLRRVGVPVEGRRRSSCAPRGRPPRRGPRPRLAPSRAGRRPRATRGSRRRGWPPAGSRSPTPAPRCARAEPTPGSSIPRTAACVSVSPGPITPLRRRNTVDKLTTSDKLILGGGIVYLIAMFLPWWGIDTGFGDCVEQRLGLLPRRLAAPGPHRDPGGARRRHPVLTRHEDPRPADPVVAGLPGRRRRGGGHRRAPPASSRPTSAPAASASTSTASSACSSP